MRSYFAPPGCSMTPGTALYGANVRQLAGVDAGPARPLGRCASAPFAAVPKLSRGGERSAPYHKDQRGSDW
jgi:hypothetical protein